uniref:Uncharacterized protein n=1 Tax=Grammatophora oceanica TaxID=210454 RepID=A0A7S1UX90_9STRA
MNGSNQVVRTLQLLLNLISVWGICFCSISLWKRLCERTRWFGFNPTESNDPFKTRLPNSLVEILFAVLSIGCSLMVGMFMIGASLTLFAIGDWAGDSANQMNPCVAEMVPCAALATVVATLVIGAMNSGGFGVLPTIEVHDVVSDVSKPEASEEALISKV